ncbi:neurofibromin [Anaeramoeba ignava]|uniref:Neurofibromin n=1 Tax=Anaeramoeba ignava TaxID=1746090 RepID=A0A9Q0RJB3_ANAIG|nr:neurofibromin [Anaeramoeba ignava]
MSKESVDAISLFRFVSKDSQVVDLQKDDNLKIINKIDDNWVKVKSERTQQEGILPFSYIKILEPQKYQDLFLNQEEKTNGNNSSQNLQKEIKPQRILKKAEKYNPNQIEINKEFIRHKYLYIPEEIPKIPVTIKGNLLILTKPGKWKKRFFELENTSIKIYKPDKTLQTDLLVEIHIKDILGVIKYTDDNKLKFKEKDENSFQIICKSEFFHIKAENLQTVDEWVHSILLVKSFIGICRKNADQNDLQAIKELLSLLELIDLKLKEEREDILKSLSENSNKKKNLSNNGDKVKESQEDETSNLTDDKNIIAQLEKLKETSSDIGSWTNLLLVKLYLANCSKEKTSKHQPAIVIANHQSTPQKDPLKSQTETKASKYDFVYIEKGIEDSNWIVITQNGLGEIPQEKLLLISMETKENKEDQTKKLRIKNVELTDSILINPALELMKKRNTTPVFEFLSIERKADFYCQIGKKMSNWKPRTLVICSFHLQIYGIDEKKTEDVIPLKNILTVQKIDVGKSHKKFYFEIVSSKRTFKLYSASKSLVDDWIYTLNLLMDLVQIKNPITNISSNIKNRTNKIKDVLKWINTRLSKLNLLLLGFVKIKNTIQLKISVQDNFLRNFFLKPRKTMQKMKQNKTNEANDLKSNKDKPNSNEEDSPDKTNSKAKNTKKKKTRKETEETTTENIQRKSITSVYFAQTQISTTLYEISLFEKAKEHFFQVLGRLNFPQVSNEEKLCYINQDVSLELPDDSSKKIQLKMGDWAQISQSEKITEQDDVLEINVQNIQVKIPVKFIEQIPVADYNDVFIQNSEAPKSLISRPQSRVKFSFNMEETDAQDGKKEKNKTEDNHVHLFHESLNLKKSEKEPEKSKQLKNQPRIDSLVKNYFAKINAINLNTLNKKKGVQSAMKIIEQWKDSIGDKEYFPTNESGFLIVTPSRKRSKLWVVLSSWILLVYSSNYAQMPIQVFDLRDLVSVQVQVQVEKSHNSKSFVLNLEMDKQDLSLSTESEEESKKWSNIFEVLLGFLLLIKETGIQKANYQIEIEKLNQLLIWVESTKKIYKTEKSGRENLIQFYKDCDDLDTVNNLSKVIEEWEQKISHIQIWRKRILKRLCRRLFNAPEYKDVYFAFAKKDHIPQNQVVSNLSDVKDNNPNKILPYKNGDWIIVKDAKMMNDDKKMFFMGKLQNKANQDQEMEGLVFKKHVCIIFNRGMKQETQNQPKSADEFSKELISLSKNKKTMSGISINKTVTFLSYYSYKENDPPVFKSGSIFYLISSKSTGKWKLATLTLHGLNLSKQDVKDKRLRKILELKGVAYCKEIDKNDPKIPNLSSLPPDYQINILKITIGSHRIFLSFSKLDILKNWIDAFHILNIAHFLTKFQAEEKPQVDKTTFLKEEMKKTQETKENQDKNENQMKNSLNSNPTENLNGNLNPNPDSNENINANENGNLEGNEWGENSFDKQNQETKTEKISLNRPEKIRYRSFSVKHQRMGNILKNQENYQEVVFFRNWLDKEIEILEKQGKAMKSLRILYEKNPEEMAKMNHEQILMDGQMEVIKKWRNKILSFLLTFEIQNNEDKEVRAYVFKNLNPQFRGVLNEKEFNEKFGKEKITEEKEDKKSVYFSEKQFFDIVGVIQVNEKQTMIKVKKEDDIFYIDSENCEIVHPITILSSSSIFQEKRANVLIAPKKESDDGSQNSDDNEQEDEFEELSLTSEQCEEFSDLMFSNNFQIVSSLFRVVKIGDADAISKNLVLMSSAKSKLLELLSFAIGFEVDETIFETTLFRGNSMCNKMLSFLGKTFGNSYLRWVLSDFIQEIIILIATSEGNPFEFRNCETEEKNQEGIQLVSKFTQKLLDRIFSSAPHFPLLMREVCFILSRETKRKFPYAHNVVLAGFVFLRFVCPAIVAPELFDVAESEHAISSKVRKVLVVISRIVQNIANLSTFKTGSESVVFNELISSNLERVKKFMTDLVEYCYVVPAIKDYVIEDEKKIDQLGCDKKLKAHLSEDYKEKSNLKFNLNQNENLNENLNENQNPNQKFLPFNIKSGDLFTVLLHNIPENQNIQDLDPQTNIIVCPGNSLIEPIIQVPLNIFDWENRSRDYSVEKISITEPQLESSIANVFQLLSNPIVRDPLFSDLSGKNEEIEVDKDDIDFDLIDELRKRMQSKSQKN